MIDHTLEWQCVGDDDWEFGQVVRGMIREIRGCVSFDPERNTGHGGWVWLIPGGPRGLAANRQDAARCVEEAVKG